MMDKIHNHPFKLKRIKESRNETEMGMGET